MWIDSPEKISVEKDQYGLLVVTILFSNPPFEPRKVEFRGVHSEDNIKALAYNQGKAWDDADEAAIVILPGPLDVKPVDPPKPPDPTQDEVDRAAFQVTYQLAVRLQRASEIVPSAVKLYADAAADADSKFKPEYTDLL